MFRRRNRFYHSQKLNVSVAFGALLVAFVFFVSGLTTILKGCNRNVAGSCAHYNRVRATVTDHLFFQTECSHCDQYSSSPHSHNRRCIRSHTYPCYNDYTIFDIYGDEDVCQVQTCIRDKSERLCRLTESKYPVGNTYILLQSKSDSSVCVTTADGFSEWRTGVILLCLASVCVLFGCSMYFILMESSERQQYLAFVGYTNYSKYSDQDDSVVANKTVYNGGGAAGYNEVELGNNAVNPMFFNTQQIQQPHLTYSQYISNQSNLNTSTANDPTYVQAYIVPENQVVHANNNSLVHGQVKTCSEPSASPVLSTTTQQYSDAGREYRQAYVNSNTLTQQFLPTVSIQSSVVPTPPPQVQMPHAYTALPPPVYPALSQSPKR